MITAPAGVICIFKNDIKPVGTDVPGGPRFYGIKTEIKPINFNPVTLLVHSLYVEFQYIWTVGDAGPYKVDIYFQNAMIFG